MAIINGVGRVGIRSGVAPSESNPLYLDAYGTPAVWYEMVKRFSAYTGPCIRVRRSSDNTEQNIGFVNDLLDTASLLSFVGAGNGFVTTFYTQVGTANVTNATASAQPQIVSSGALITRNGFVSIKYDGTNDTLTNYTGGFINTSDVSYFSVAQEDIASIGGIHRQAQSTVNTILTWLERGSAKEYMWIRNTSGTLFKIGMISALNSSNLRLQSSFINPSKGMSGFVNNVATGTTTYTGTTVSEGLQLGYATLYLNGSINCFGAYNTNNSANRVAIETILNNYYSIY